MDEEFRTMLNNWLNEFREWSSSRHLESCRLVQYSGYEYAGGWDIPLPEAEREIEGVLSEGFGVAWAEDKGRLCLVVFEPTNLPLIWSKVFNEEDLADPDPGSGQVGRDELSFRA